MPQETGSLSTSGYFLDENTIHSCSENGMYWDQEASIEGEIGINPAPSRMLTSTALLPYPPLAKQKYPGHFRLSLTPPLSKFKSMVQLTLFCLLQCSQQEVKSHKKKFEVQMTEFPQIYKCMKSTGKKKQKVEGRTGQTH